jgi:methyltransferase (TIGR00027 family)
VDAGGRDVVILGVGWDMRPFRLPFPQGTRIFELDFRTTLAERSRRIKELGIADPIGVTRVEIPFDMRSMPLSEVLGLQVDPRAPLFIAWEGMSMYFQEEEVAWILEGMAPLLAHPESRLWVDLVDKHAVQTPEAFPAEVQAFMRGMQVLGEPFTFGTDGISSLMTSHGFSCCATVSSDFFLGDNKDPVYALYHFCVAAGRASTLAVADVTSEANRTIRPDAPHSSPAIVPGPALPDPQSETADYADKPAS